MARVDQFPDYDVAIVGAGVSGCSVARELSRIDARTCVIEAEDDVCCGTSKANSAIVHAGFDALTGSLMARLNVEGAALMPKLCDELGVDFERIGSLVVCTDEGDLGALDALLERGRANGVSDLRIIDREELFRLEPNVAGCAVAALWAPTAGIVNPFQLTCALAESAAINGVDFRLGERVIGLDPMPDGTWRVQTSGGGFVARVVVNAAGVRADEVHAMASHTPLEIRPRRGQYYVLDTCAGGHVRHTVFSLPTRLGKGVLVTPTTAGNLLVGPTAEDIDDKGGTDTTAEGLSEVREKAALTVRDVPFREVIRTFSGLRAHRPEHDFLIGEAADAPGFVDCAGIESPGLSASPAIGRHVAAIVANLLGHPSERKGFVPTRRPIPDVARMPADEWTTLIRERPDYGRVVCRCRTVTEGQIVDAIHAPVGARSVDAVKRRVEAGMGRCQGGFCTPRIMEILAREVDGLRMEKVTKDGGGSRLVVGPTKGGEAR